MSDIQLPGWFDKKYIAPSYGALLLSTLLISVAQGVVIGQVYHYFKNFSSDPRFIRYTIWLLLVLNTVHVASSWHVAYNYLVLNYGNVFGLQLGASIWSLDLSLFLTVVVTAVVHLFNAHQIFTLSHRNWALASAIPLLTITTLALALVTAVQLDKWKPSESPRYSELFMGVALCLTTCTDCIIAGSLVFYLRRSKTTSKTTDNFVDKLVLNVVQNGILMCVIGVIGTTMFFVLGYFDLFCGFYANLSKLYTNTLLATLNNRTAFRGNQTDSSAQTIHDIVWRVPPTNSHGIDDSEDVEMRECCPSSAPDEAHSMTENR